MLQNLPYPLNPRIDFIYFGRVLLLIEIAMTPDEIKKNHDSLPNL